MKKKVSLALLYPITICALVIATYFGYKTSVESLPYYRNFSIINLKPEKIIVETSDNLIELEQFDIFNLDEEARSKSQKYIIRNTKGNFYGEFEVKRDVTADTLEILPVSDEDFCYFQADVSDIYYQNEISSLRGVKIINSGKASDRYRRVINSKIIYIYPGKSLISDLPEFIDSSQKVIGIYPIECAEAKNEANLLKTVLFYKNYNAEEQRKFYRDRLKEIENLRL